MREQANFSAKEMATIDKLRKSGLSIAQITERLGRTRGSVKNRIARARKSAEASRC